MGHGTGPHPVGGELAATTAAAFPRESVVQTRVTLRLAPGGFAGLHTRRRWLELGLKRGFDIACAAMLLLMLIPVLLTLALLVRLSSPGPILFKQERVGQDGRKFWFYKFRTMVVNNDPSA